MLQLEDRHSQSLNRLTQSASAEPRAGCFAEPVSAGALPTTCMPTRLDMPSNISELLWPAPRAAEDCIACPEQDGAELPKPWNRYRLEKATDMDFWARRFQILECLEKAWVFYVLAVYDG